jgi:4-diphosphocytidyl-2-C-methyl-D-erythritol kinase
MQSIRADQLSAVRRFRAAAAAKVNLTLEILARRPDGFHELETLMLSVSACDSLTIEATESPELVLHCGWLAGLYAEHHAGAARSAAAVIWGELPAERDNLVWKALHRLQTLSGIKQGAHITLIKRVPAQAGLGGASADAATALLAANEAWQLHWPLDRLAEVAAELGSDVPFFIGGGPAICRGRGERIESVRPVRCHLVIVRPPEGLSTPAVFQRCRPEPNHHSAAAVQTALVRGDLAAVARGMHNGLQPAAEALSPWIGRLRVAFSRSGAVGHQMSGSGSSYLGLFWNAGQARRAARRLRGQNLGAVLCAATASAPGLAAENRNLREERQNRGDSAREVIQ